MFNADICRWNALFTGTYTMITLEEKRRLGNEFDMNNYVRFRTRTGVETQEGRDRLRQEFTDLSKVVILSFRSGRATPESGLPNPKNPLNYYLGTTHSPYIYQTPATLVRLNFELLEPLMSMKLNPTERALEIFRIAAVLMHESAVKFPRRLVPRGYINGRDTDMERLACSVGCPSTQENANRLRRAVF